MRVKKSSGQIKRKANTRNVNPKIIIVCEGETERDYFDFFKQNTDSALKNACIARDDAIKRKGNNPYTQIDLLITYLHDIADGKKVKSNISFPMPV